MLKAKHREMEFVIEEDAPEVGVYLYIYRNGECIRDELQNDVATCIAIALEGYGVPRASWIECNDSQGL